MRRGRTLIIVGLLLIIVIAGGYLIYTRFIQPGQTPPLTVGEQPQEETPDVAMQPAVRLTQPVSRGTVINETMLDTVSVPQESFLPGMFSEFGEVVGRKARYDLEAGMLLTSQVLLDTGEALPLGGSDWALVIEPGKVAVSIPISRLSAVSYAPQSGDAVDVIATMLMIDLDTDFQSPLPNNVSGCVTGPGIPEEQSCLTASGPGFQGRTEVDPALGVPFYIVPADGQRPRMVSQSVLRNVTVLRVGDFPFADPEGNMITTAEAVATPEPDDATQQQQAQPAEQEQQQQPEVRLPDVITLIVDPQDAVTLNYLVYSGAELTLALRAAGDDTVDPTEAVTLQFLLDEYNIPVPVKLPFGLQNDETELVAPTLPNDTPAEEQNP